MGIEEFRETLEQSQVTVGLNEKIAIVQKKINLQSGKRHTLMAVDFMDDSFILPTDQAIRGYEFFVSPYPIIYTEMRLAEVLENRGPLASDDAVLFKQSAVFLGFNTGGVFVERLPNQFLGAMPTYNWYTPQLYLTLILHKEQTGSAWTVDDLGMSVYLAVKSVNADAVEYGMGVIREYTNAQGRNLMSQGRQIPPSNNVQQSFPSWRWGGVRPAYMLAGSPGSNDFFVQAALNDTEIMISTQTLGTYMGQAAKMVRPDQPFGTRATSNGDIPDWLRVTLKNMGLWFGNLRADEVPRFRRHGNGNVQMFTDNGTVA